MPVIRRKRPAEKQFEARLDALRSDIDTLQTDVKGLASDAGGVANDRAKMAVRAAEAIAERAYRLAQDTVSQKANEMGAWANDNLDTARDQVREQPLSALLVSLGIGMILGAIFLRS